MPKHTFTLNGDKVAVEAPDDVRLLWVLRDLLGVTGPKYGCALAVCQACTSHVNGQAVNVCAVPVGQLRPSDRVTTIEGLAASVGADLHPAQQVWMDLDVAQCGYCQPGQIMAAVALINKAIAEKRTVTEADLDDFHNVCRCGTYPRIRAAILETARVMTAAATTPSKATVIDQSTARGSLPATGRDADLAPAAVAAAVGLAISAAVAASRSEGAGQATAAEDS